MRPYSEAVKADVRHRMSPPNRQSVVEIARELVIHAITLYKWRKGWRLQGEVVPASEREAESWSAADKFTVVLETASLNGTELGGYCRERGLYPEQVGRWNKAAQDANALPLLTMSDQKDLQKRHQEAQREIKRRQHCCSRRLLRSSTLQKRSRPTGERAGRIDHPRGSAEGSGDPGSRAGRWGQGPDPGKPSGSRAEHPAALEAAVCG